MTDRVVVVRPASRVAVVRTPQIVAVAAPGPQGRPGDPGPMGPPGDATQAVGGQQVRDMIDAAFAAYPGVDWFTGVGPPPSVVVGAGPGDMYIDTSNGALYQLH